MNELRPPQQVPQNGGIEQADSTQFGTYFRAYFPVKKKICRKLGNNPPDGTAFNRVLQRQKEEPAPLKSICVNLG